MAEQAVISGGENGSIGDLVFDALISENHGVKITLTKNKLEDGSNVQDHAIVEPDSLSMTVFWSDMNHYDAENKILLGTAREQWEALETLAKGLEAVTVVTNLKVYSSMMVTQLGTLKGAQDGIGITCNVTLEPLRLVGLQTEVIEVSDEAAHQVTKPSPKTKPTNTTDEDTEEKSSAAWKLLYG